MLTFYRSVLIAAVAAVAALIVGAQTATAQSSCPNCDDMSNGQAMNCGYRRFWDCEDCYQPEIAKYPKDPCTSCSSETDRYVFGYAELCQQMPEGARLWALGFDECDTQGSFIQFELTPYQFDPSFYHGFFKDPHTGQLCLSDPPEYWVFNVVYPPCSPWPCTTPSTQFPFEWTEIIYPCCN